MVDGLRILAAFCVVAAHASCMESPTVFEILVRLAAIWTYPFFFLVAGYYLGRSDHNLCTRAPGQIARLTWLLLVSSLLFVPYVLGKEGVSNGLRDLSSFSVLCTGSYYHLWFLGSMVVGLLVVYSAFSLGFQTYLGPISVALVCFALFGRSYNPSGNAQYAVSRYLLSVPFIYFGVCLARRPTLPGPKAAVAMVVAGAILQCVEACLLWVFLGKNPISHLFLVGTILIAVGLLILGLNLPQIKWPLWSKLGRDYSLGVYIVHPLWIPVAREIMVRLPFFSYTRRALVIPVLIASMASLMLLEKFLPSVKKALEGQFVRVQQAAA